MIDSELRDLYQELILDHGKNPHNFRAIKDSNRNAVGHNPLCGDKLILYLIVDDKNCIKDVAFQGSGCAISVASASMMTEIVMGKTFVEAEKIFKYFHAVCTGQLLENKPDISVEDMARLGALSGVQHYPMRVKCATLAWHTLQAAIHDDKKVSTE
jgi:nitrogen fixation NifU-like protein